MYVAPGSRASRLVKLIVVPLVLVVAATALASPAQASVNQTYTYPTFNFGSIAENATSRVVSLGFDSAQTTQVTAVVVSGAAFRRVGGSCNPGVVVSPTVHCDVSVLAAPAAIGTFTGEIRVIATNSYDTVIPLVVQGLGTYVDASRAAFDFDPLLVGGSATLATTLTNTGTLLASFTKISTPSGATFTLDAGSSCTPTTTLRPGESCTLRVTAHPGSVGTLTDVLRINFTGAANLDIPISVTAVSPTLVVSGNNNHGSVRVGTWSAPVTQTLTNTSPGEVDLTGIGGVNGPSVRYLSSSTCAWNTKLAAGASCTLVLTASPAGTGPQVYPVLVTFQNAPSLQINQYMQGV